MSKKSYEDGSKATAQQMYRDMIEGTYVEPGHDVAEAAVKALYDVDTRPGPNAGRSIRQREMPKFLGFNDLSDEDMAYVELLASPEAGLDLPAKYLDPVACAIRLVRLQAAEIKKLKHNLYLAGRTAEKHGHATIEVER